MVYKTIKSLLTAICDAVRFKDGTTEPINHQDIPDRIKAISSGGIVLPTLTNEGTSSDILEGKQLINSEGSTVTGIIKTFDGSYELEIKATGDTTLHTAGKYCEEDILIKVTSDSSGTSASIDTCTIMVSSMSGDVFNSDIIITTFESSSIDSTRDSFLSSNGILIFSADNVVCNSCICVTLKNNDNTYVTNLSMSSEKATLLSSDNGTYIILLNGQAGDTVTILLE